mgnify:CR=1 FL=1
MVVTQRPRELTRAQLKELRLVLDQAGYTEAALHGSSHLVMGPVMRWLTFNIGYHHVHHLNSKIPGYRLPEAMAAIEELQSPRPTSLSPTDVLACLRLVAWDPGAQRMHAAAELATNAQERRAS